MRVVEDEVAAEQQEKEQEDEEILSRKSYGKNGMSEI
jgi:hypothetical protein